ncbi:MAG TPA: sugar phosphate isomerase/epimerase [Planctomycetota bacterium]|mgnify:FL=1|nr:sugar phosphate isomerase/epimerase [Planctomycetota bacterium]HRR82307.1 sugar phosphate isomerase/epimerase [Planctomycetota bacterium]HRT97575.1 sugar phosphate isomerase/epimerase [Planctomycetota bacterium]
MQIGFLTACMGKKSLEDVVRVASELGFAALEVSVGHLPADRAIKEASKIKDLFAENGLAISSLAAYSNLLEADEAKRQAAIAAFKKNVDACVAVGTPILCAMTGMPVPGKSKEQTIAEDFKTVFTPLAQYAEDKGIKIAFENWFPTLLQHFDLWDAILAAVPSPAIGFNYDPSHLIWQGIDYLGGVDRYKDRIFHTHAKDTEMKAEVLARRGCLAGGWWRYVIPGYGSVEWGKYVGRLRQIGYKGVLSIEHEDGAFSPEDGLDKGIKYLRLFV